MSSNDNDFEFWVDYGVTEMKIFFDPEHFSPDQEEVETVAEELKHERCCINVDLDGLTNGEVRVLFNPIFHDRKTREYVEKMLEEVIAEV